MGTEPARDPGTTAGADGGGGGNNGSASTGGLARRVSEVEDIVRGLVDLDILGDWMDGQDLPSGAIEDVEALAGGTQNALIAFTRGERSYVLRRGPEHLRASSNDVIRREMRVLEALADSDVPHPGFIAGCPDETVMNGAAFYLMERVDGFNATTTLPRLHAEHRDVLHEMGLQVAEGAARLGAVDFEAVGLADFGRPDGFLERQVPRWREELASYDGLDGYPGPEIPAVDEVGDWLDANRPTDWRPGLMHGDYHLANVLFAPDSPKLAAIVDWEMCTVGDPLLDLGWLLATWPGGDHQAAALVTGQLGTADGLPDRDELIERYSRWSDRDLGAVDWYTVMACFKLGIVLEGTYARALAGKAPMATGELLHAITLGLFARASDIIETS